MRNSWGIGWMDNGLIKLEMGKNNFGIDSDCYAPNIDN